MRCPICGKNIRKNSKFCGNCGTKLDNDATRLYDEETSSYKRERKLKELYKDIYDSVYQQAEEIIEELEDRRKKISLPDSSFIASVHPYTPTTKSIFLPFEESYPEGKTIDDDMRYCEETFSNIRSLLLALRAEDRKFLKTKFTSLELSLRELKNKKNEFVRSMENLRNYSYYDYDSIEAFHRDLGAAQDICTEYDIRCKENIINFLDKALKTLYSLLELNSFSVE
ncbi:MAG: zinc ribbon domain-containing protein [Candidatus Methanofastidiosia archaeon]|jgi:hypothetical protein